MFLYTFIFLTAAHFHHSLPLLFLITRFSSFSVIHVSVGIKNNIEKDVVFFSLNVRVAMRFPAEKTRVAFGLPYLLIELFFIGMPVVRMDGRTYGLVTTKIS